MIEFIHIPLVSARNKGVAMETSEIKHSPNKFFHGNIIEYHSVDTNKQVGTHEKKSPGGCMVGPTGPRTNMGAASTANQVWFQNQFELQTYY